MNSMHQLVSDEQVTESYFQRSEMCSVNKSTPLETILVAVMPIELLCCKTMIDEVSGTSHL